MSAKRKDVELLTGMYGCDMKASVRRSEVCEPCGGCAELYDLLRKVREEDCRRHIEEGVELLPLTLRRRIQSVLNAA